MRCSIDRIRAAYPHIGLAVYAYEPGGTVTIEMLNAQGGSFSFTAPSADAAARKACPELFIDEQPVEDAPAPLPETLFD